MAIFTQWNRIYWMLQLLSGDCLESMSKTVQMATRIPSNWLPSHLVMSRLSTRPPVSVYQRQNLSHSPFIYKSLKYNMTNNANHCLITLKWWSKIICIREIYGCSGMCRYQTINRGATALTRNFSSNSYPSKCYQLKCVQFNCPHRDDPGMGVYL